MEETLQYINYEGYSKNLSELIVSSFSLSQGPLAATGAPAADPVAGAAGGAAPADPNATFYPYFYVKLPDGEISFLSGTAQRIDINHMVC